MTSACILGCAGIALSRDERALFTRAQPWGMILFARNIRDPEQVAALVDEFRGIVGRADAPVLIDQEGGRVQRLRPPHWPDFPPAERFGTLSTRDRTEGVEATRLGARLIASELTRLGINVDCLPVADLRLPEGHGIIGDRAYGAEPVQVAELARAAAEGLLAGGVLPVVKHMPGHGRARADSHEALPIVDTPVAELERTDFEAFRRLADLPIGMTAHVVYSAVDRALPATISPTVIGEVVRGRIGFRNLLLTDDLSMKALTGSLGERARRAVAAGCDIALHCNGDLGEMAEVVEAAPTLAGEAARRADAALGRLRRTVEPIDVAEAYGRFSAMIGVA